MVDMAADPTEEAREDTDRAAAMEAARDTAVDRVEVRETPERFLQIQLLELLGYGGY